jgi:hypothetical protein
VVGGIFLVFGPELLTHTPLSTQWFPLAVGAILIAQVIFTPQGVVVDWQERFRKRFPPGPRFPGAPEAPTQVLPIDVPEPEPVGMVKV